MNKGKLLAWSIIILMGLSVSGVYGAYILKNNGDIYFDSTTTYVDSTPIGTYVASIASGIPYQPQSIERNIGFVTRMSGSIPITVGQYNTGAFDHGLAGDPAVVQITIGGDSPGSHFFQLAGDGQHMTVYVENPSSGGMVAMVTATYLTPM